MPSLWRPFYLVFLLFLVPLLAACGGDSETPAGSGLPDHLLVNSNGLLELTNGKSRTLISVDGGAYVNGVDVSPDGKQLAFVLQPPATTNARGEIDFGSDLYISNRDGSNRRELVKHDRNGEFIFTPFWQPDGRSIVYVVRGRDEIGLPDFRLESVDVASGARTRLISNAVEAGISRDGKTAAYVHYASDGSQSEQFLLSDLGSSSPPVTLVPADKGLLLIGSPSFSPDGSRIAFAASNLFTKSPGSGGGGARGMAAMVHPTLQDVWVVNRDGSDLRLLAEIIESQPSVDWAPDGKTIYALGGANLWRIDPESGAHESVGQGAPGGIIKMLHP